MAHPLPPGLTPAEVAFLCEMELVTVIPRQRLDSLELLGGPTPDLRPPYRSNIPLWLAILLKNQRRATIVPPPWLSPASLTEILEFETEHSREAFSPAPPLPAVRSTTNDPPSDPFLSHSTSDAASDALPYHWMEMAELLLANASDDFEDPDAVRRLLRDLREVRMEKLRRGTEVLSGESGVKMNGVGAMEVAETRAFVTGVIDGLRRIGASRELSRRDRELEERENGYGGTQDEDDMSDT